MTSEKHEEKSAADSAAPETINAERRAFFRTAALAAGAVSVVGATIAAGEAQAAPAAADLKSSRKVLQAAFDGKYQVSIEHIHAAIEQMLEIGGCLTCGLVGFDLNLRVNPIERLRIEIPTTIESF